MLLNILHVHVVVLCVVVGATSVAIAGRWELHFHHVWWVRDVQVLFLSILWRHVAGAAAVAN